MLKIKIDTGDKKPTKSKPYRTPLLDSMLDDKIIRKLISLWVFLAVLVNKKIVDEDNLSPPKRRFCNNYRKLNQVTKVNSYPLERIADILDLLKGSKYFTSFDLRPGYWQIAMQDDSRKK